MLNQSYDFQEPLDLNEIDYEEIDWDEFANLDMIDDLSDVGDNLPEAPKVVKKKPPLVIKQEVKDLLKWVTATANHQAEIEYAHNDYPVLSSHVDPKGHGRGLRLTTKFKRITPPINFIKVPQISSIYFKDEEVQPKVQPLMVSAQEWNNLE